MPDDDDDADDAAFAVPLPPEDRLWRHPSEMNEEGAKQQIVLVSKPPDVALKRIKSSQESDRRERLRRNLPDVPPAVAKASDETFTISTLQKI